MTEPWLASGLAGLLGLMLGSFLNVCSLRWPNHESVIRPPSRCAECGERVRSYDNIPVLSWIVLGGRCRNCSIRISVQYPLVELGTALIWGGMVWNHGLEAEALRGALFLSILLGIAVSDARFYIIPDQFSLGGVAVGLGLALATQTFGIAESLLGGLVGFTLLWFVAWVGEKAFKKEAMGGGDIKMMAMIGTFLGIQGVFLSLFLGSLLGAVIFGPISYKTGKLVPFGIFLAVGAGATYLSGERWVDWYLRWAFGG